MKKLLCLFTLVLAGCSQAYLDQQAAERDNAWCESMGISAKDPRYTDCRITAARNRQIEAQNNAVIGLGMMGAGTSIYNAGQPRPPVTCTAIGNTTTCQ